MSEWVGDAINACNPVTVTVTRYAAATAVKGRVQDPVVGSTFPIVASIQPLTQKELELLPEGMDARGRVKVYTQTELRTVDVSQTGIPDRFDYNGVEYLVEMADNWVDYGDYFKFIAVRTDR